MTRRRSRASRAPTRCSRRSSQSLNETIDESPEFFVILLELHTLARRNEEIAAEVAELHRRVREHLAAAARGRRATRA